MDEQTVAPAQPVSVHKQGNGHMIAMVLGVVFVIETGLLGYGVMKYSELKNSTPAPIERAADNKDSSSAGTPFFYMRDVEDSRRVSYQELVEVDRVSGEEEVVWRQEVLSSHYSIFAVPQIGYDGTVYLDASTEGDNPSLNLYELSLGDGTLTPVSFDAELPFIGQASVLSKDERKIASVYYNPAMEENSREVVVWDLATGNRAVIGKISESEYFSNDMGENIFGGAYGYQVRWSDLECVTAWVYEDGSDPSSTSKDAKEKREYCIE